ncbi:MAG: ParB N-terminal domain-containing protein [Anaerolineae bacterium]
MSNKNRRDVLAKNDPFRITDEVAAPTLRDTDSQLFSGKEKFAEVDSRRQVATPHSIYEIFPDVTQPRRAMPSAVRAEWDGQVESLGALLRLWEQAINDERAAQGNPLKFDVLELLNFENPHDSEGHGAASYLESAFLEIVQLAASIRRDGLTNPITIMRTSTPNIFRLETGERRWLAYHLLATYFPHEDKWRTIPARKVETFNVWRQASENTARQDLNAIGKARQYAVLMMDLLTRETGMEFQAFDAFPHERQYYAQVLATDKTPYGKRDVLLNAMGLKSPAELNRCRKMLALPDRVWTAADDLSTAQALLLQIEGLSEDQAFQIVSSWNDSEAAEAVAAKTAEGDDTAAKTTAERAAVSPDDIERNLERVRLSIAKTFGKLRRSEKISPKQREQFRTALTEYERMHSQWLSDIKNWLDS